MVKIKLTTAWSYQGKWYEAGETLEVLEATAVNLVGRGVAEEVQEEKPAKKANVKPKLKKGDNKSELD